MKVIFYCNADISDEYDFPDDTSEWDLFDAANDWVADNVCGHYTIVDEDKETE